MKRTSLPLLAALTILTSCASAPDFSPYRSAIAERLRDPASAEFKDEKIRTLWSQDGGRFKIYCAMLNTNNAFGGKTGFRPATVVISAVNVDRDSDAMVKSVYSPNKAFLDEEMTPDYYLNCQRADTQRKNGSLFLSWLTMGRKWDADYQKKVDAEVPILSNKAAPDEPS